MANEKISQFVVDNNLISYTGFAGYVNAGGGVNLNRQISGQYLRHEIINSNNSAQLNRIPFYGSVSSIGGGADNDTSLGGSESFKWDQTNHILQIGVPGGGNVTAGKMELIGNYLAGDIQPKITFKGGESTTPNSFDFTITTAENAVDQSWILPSTLPSNGQVLEANAVSNNDVTLSWATPASGGGLDFSGLDITTIKADLTQSSQPQYGSAITIKANGAISNGDIVVFNYDTGEVRGEVASTLPAQNIIAGVAIEDIADTATGKVLIYGYATVKYNNFAPASPAPAIILDGTSSGNTTVLTPGVTQPFYDQGGIGTGSTYDYSPNTTYTYVFDSGDDAEQVRLIINSCDFEGTGSNAWDRLGFQESDFEAGPYVNCQFSPGLANSTNYSSGWRRMVNSTTWQSGTSGNEDVVQGPYADGYVLPGNDSSFTLPLTVTSTKRFVKAFFDSDGSPNGDGWNIDVETTATTSPTNTPIGGNALIDISDLAAATNNQSTGRNIGITVGGTFANNAAVVFVEPPRVQ